MSRHGRYDCPAWDADPRHQRIATERRGSDFNYDPRRPGNHPRPSYYGPNFREIEQGRSQSFTNRVEPKMPKPYVKNPQPYPPGMAKEHDEYHDHGTNARRAYRKFANVDPEKYGRKHDPDVRGERYQTGHRLATETRTHANLHAAARRGFDHKYPFAYESEEAKQDRRVEAIKALNTARHMAAAQERIREKQTKFGHKH